MDPALDLDRGARHERAAVIDREADRLNRLVTNLLDMSRIEAGDLRARLEPFPLEDVVETTLERLAELLAGRPVTVVDARRPPARGGGPGVHRPGAHEPPGERGAPRAPGVADPCPRRAVDAGFVRLTVEDGGPGVPPDALARIFDKFSRIPAAGDGSRPGAGIGLAVVRGLVAAMGGRVAARASELGGLAIDVDLRAAPAPAGGRRGHRPVRDRAMTAGSAPGALVLARRGRRPRRAARSRPSWACTASGSSEAGDATTALERWEAQRPGPCPPGPRASGRRRLGRDPAGAARRGDADRGPVGARPGGGEGGRAGAGRRRLRDEAVQRGRAPRSPAGRPPARGRTGGGSTRRAAPRRPGDGRDAPRGDGRGSAGPPHARASSRSSRCWCPTPAGWSRTAGFCGRCGGPPTPTRPTTSTSTSARSGASSPRPIPTGGLAGLIVGGAGRRLPGPDARRRSDPERSLSAAATPAGRPLLGHGTMLGTWKATHGWHPGSGSEAERAAAEEQRARDLAAVELRAAIAIVARDPAYRVVLCGMATDAATRRRARRDRGRRRRRPRAADPPRWRARRRGAQPGGPSRPDERRREAAPRSQARRPARPGGAAGVPLLPLRPPRGRGRAGRGERAAHAPRAGRLHGAPGPLRAADRARPRRSSSGCRSGRRSRSSPATSCRRSRTPPRRACSPCSPRGPWPSPT